MNYVKHLFCVLFLLVVSASLTGCFVATPDTNEIIYMQPYETKTFSVEGPSTFKYNWTVKNINNFIIEEGPNSHSYTFCANIEEFEINAFYITCYILYSKNPHFNSAMIPIKRNKNRLFEF